MADKKKRGSKFQAWIETGDAVLDEPMTVGKAYFEPNIKPGTAEVMSKRESDKLARELALKKLMEKKNGR